MVKIPVQYTEEVLRGREVELEFFLEEAKRIQLPEAGDELAKRCGAESLEDLKGRIRKELEAHRKVHVESIQEERLLDTVAAMVQFDLPEGLLEEQLKMQRMRTEFSLIQEGLPREQIDERLKKADETAAEDIRKEMKRYFILEKIAEKEKIFTTEDDVELRVALLARAYGQQARDVMAELEEGGKIDTLRAEIRHSKVRRFLMEKSSAGKAAGAEATAEATAAAPAAAEAPAEEPQQGT
jgi:trigger factor